MINPGELLAVVDENNKPLRPEPRKVVHAKDLWHRSAHIWIVNDKGQVLCQLRSKDKDIKPGSWESFFGGHVEDGKTFEETAISELYEELGISLGLGDLTLFKVFKNYGDIDVNIPHRQFIGIFLLKWNGDIKELKFEKEEIDDLKWVDLKKIKEILQVKIDGWSLPNYGLEMVNWLTSK